MSANYKVLKRIKLTPKIYICEQDTKKPDEEAPPGHGYQSYEKSREEPNVAYPMRRSYRSLVHLCHDRPTFAKYPWQRQCTVCLFHRRKVSVIITNASARTIESNVDICVSIEIFYQRFDTADEASGTTCEDGGHGYR